MTRFDTAKKIYAEKGVDVENALSKMKALPISIHCWQGDDVLGFERNNGPLSGGIQTTGNYPGRASNPDQLMQDFAFAINYIGGRKKINLHASYAVTDGDVGRDALEGKHFDSWIEFAKKHHLGIDFNPTFFSHPMVKDNMTLSSPNAKVRDYWIQHGIASRRISSYIGERLGDEVLCNIWVPDGMKDVTGDRRGPRVHLKDSLDTILAKPLPYVVDSVESKVFGIGIENYTVGSAEFYLCYAAQHSSVYPLTDLGHYHPTENVSDKISTLSLMFDRIPLHVTRPVRWDSDHVVSFDDQTRALADEIVRANVLDKVMLGLDFFDASINRIAAWILGTRNTQKALLYALTQNVTKLRDLQNTGNFTELLIETEHAKTMPFGDLWDEYCRRQNVALDAEWFQEVKTYEENVLSLRTH